MGIDIVFRIAGIGILVAVACQLLKQTGRDDIAMLTALERNANGHFFINRFCGCDSDFELHCASIQQCGGNECCACGRRGHIAFNYCESERSCSGTELGCRIRRP